MKKKFLLTFAIVTVLFCLFAVGISAVTIYDDFDVTALENIEYRADDIIVFDDGFSCPSVYVFKDTKTVSKGNWGKSDGLKNTLDFAYINSKVAPDKEYGFDDIDSIDIPQGVTSISTYACNGMTTIRKISIPDTVTNIGSGAFQNASGLEFCIMEHKEISGLTTLSGSLFSGSGLKAFSMPDCITNIDSGSEFANCKSMTAVYLSKNLTSIAGSKSCFDYCEKMYLVNDPFVAMSEGQIPAKPSIYYFPSNLTVLGSDSVGVFRGSSSINDVLVFGTKITAITNRVAFQGCPKNTIVFLGNMTDVVAYETYYWGTKNFIFANPEDKSASDLNKLELKSSSTAYFCYGDNVSHLVEKQLSTGATCTLPAMTADYCFCGQRIPNTESTVGNALGHSHTIYLGTVYENYMAEGYKEYECDRCGNVNADKKAPALFTCLGYSAPENGDGGISIRYSVNSLAINEYKQATGIELSYGLFATTKQAIGNADIFDGEGNTINGAIALDITKADFAFLSLKMVGFDTEESKKVDFAIGAYVVTTQDGQKSCSYLQQGTPADGEKYAYVKYNDFVSTNI